MFWSRGGGIGFYNNRGEEPNFSIFPESLGPKGSDWCSFQIDGPPQAILEPRRVRVTLIPGSTLGGSGFSFPLPPSQTQPRKCAPTANLDTQLTAFCTRNTFCTRCSKPVADFWLQIWLILRVWHTSRSESASAQNQCLAYSSFSSCSLFEFSPFQKNAHDFAVWYRSSCAHDAARLVSATFKTLAACEIPVFYSCF